MNEVEGGDHAQKIEARIEMVRMNFFLNKYSAV